MDEQDVQAGLVFRPPEWSPVPAPAAHKPWQRKPVILTAAGTLAAALAAVILIATGVIGGPSYPHAWCGPVIAQLQATGGTQGAFESGLAKIQRQDHAPVGKLLTDIYTYDFAQNAVQNASIEQGLGALGAEGQVLNRVGADLRMIGRECHQAPNAYKH